MERVLKTLRGFMIILVLLCARSGWGSIFCPLARQGFSIPPRTNSIFFFSNGFHGPRTPCLGLLYFSFVMYKSWWRRVWMLASTTHWLIFVPIYSGDGAQPWRGPRENDEYFFSCLIMALTTVGDLVTDIAVVTDMNFTSLMSLIWIQLIILWIWYLLQIVDFIREFYSCLQKYWQTCIGPGEWQEVVWVVLQPMMSIAPPPPPPRAHVPVTKKPKNVAAVKRRRVEDSE